MTDVVATNQTIIVVGGGIHAAAGPIGRAGDVEMFHCGAQCSGE